MFAKLLAKMHAHKAPRGWCGGAPYARTEYRGTDGLGVEHHAVVLQCASCGKNFDVAMIHRSKQ